MSTIKTLILLAILIGTGCASLTGATAEDDRTMTEEQREALLEIGGEELVADAQIFLDAPHEGEGYFQANACLYRYLLAIRQEEEGDANSARANYGTCNSFCSRASKVGVRHSETTDKYATICEGERARLMGEDHIRRARKELAVYDDAQGAFDVSRKRRGAAGAISQAREELGDDHPGLVEVEDELARIDEKNAEELEQVRAFQARDDVQAVESERNSLESQIRLINGQIAELDGLINYYNEANMRNEVYPLEEQRQARLDQRIPLQQRLEELYEEWRTLAQDAGLISAP